MIAFAPYENPTVAVSIILENGGAGPSVGDITRQILDHYTWRQQHRVAYFPAFTARGSEE